jgi:hypothetical protein
MGLGSSNLFPRKGNEMTTTTKTTAKSTPAKVVVPEDDKVIDVIESETVALESPDNASPEAPVEKTGNDRIPTALANQSMLADFVKRYLAAFDEISEYNKAVLAEKDSEWSTAKVLEKAREFGRNDDTEKIDPKISAALDAWEKLVGEAAKARKAVLDVTSEKLGIQLSATATRDSDVEAKLKESRNFAITIGKQLSTIAEMTNDKVAGAETKEFLTEYAIPMIGRDQVRNLGDHGGKATAKHRVTVEVFDKDGKSLLIENGFTNAKFAIAKFYDRGKGLTADALREVWEKALAANPNITATQFNDNEMDFVITKK